MDLACLVVQRDLVLQLTLQFQVDLGIPEDPEHQVAPSLQAVQHHLLVQLLQGCQENHCYPQDLEGRPCQEHHWVLGALGYHCCQEDQEDHAHQESQQHQDHQDCRVHPSHPEDQEDQQVQNHQ